MVYVKLIRHTYGGLEYLKNAIFYLGDKEERKGVGGYGANPYNLHRAYEQMRYIRIYYNKLSGNPLIHLIVSYDECVQDAETACEYTRKIAKYLGDSYQLLWAVHKLNHGVSQYHAHIVTNSVGYKNGLMFHSGRKEMKMFCNYVSNITRSECRFFFEKE